MAANETVLYIDERGKQRYARMDKRHPDGSADLDVEHDTGQVNADGDSLMEYEHRKNVQPGNRMVLDSWHVVTDSGKPIADHERPENREHKPSQYVNRHHLDENGKKVVTHKAGKNE